MSSVAARRKVYGPASVEYAPPSGEGDAFSAIRSIELPEASVQVVPGGVLCGRDPKSHSKVLAPDGTFIPEFSLVPGWGDHIDRWEDYEKPPEHLTLSGSVGVGAGIPKWDESYYHWMSQTLPRLHLIQASGIPAEKYALHALKHPFQRETLERLGIEDIIELGDSYRLQADELVVPSTVPAFSPWVCDFVRGLFPTAARNGKRLYISRPWAVRRCVANEDEVRDALSRFDFCELDPATMTVAEQAEEFASASIVVAPHGGALTNLVFCHPGTKVIELFSPRYVQPAYWMRASQCDLDYHYLVGEGPRRSWASTPDPSFALDPIVVSPDRLVDLLSDLVHGR